MVTKMEDFMKEWEAEERRSRYTLTKFDHDCLTQGLKTEQQIWDEKKNSLLCDYGNYFLYDWNIINSLSLLVWFADGFVEQPNQTKKALSNFQSIRNYQNAFRIIQEAKKEAFDIHKVQSIRHFKKIPEISDPIRKLIEVLEKDSSSLYLCDIKTINTAINHLAKIQHDDKMPHWKKIIFKAWDIRKSITGIAGIILVLIGIGLVIGFKIKEHYPNMSLWEMLKSWWTVFSSLNG
jgi:hypothetical protein